MIRGCTQPFAWLKSPLFPMISWIQRTFQQHFKWLFVALLIVVIISFVFVTNTSSGLGQGGGRKLEPRPFFGIDLNKGEDMRALASDAQLSIYLRYNPQREVSESQLFQYAQSRHASLYLADKLGLPAPSQEGVVEHIRSLRLFASPTSGAFDPKLYSEFTDSLKTNPRLTEADVSRVIAEDALVAVYEKLLAGPGYVLPADVEEMLAQRDTQWTLAIAAVSGAAFAPEIDRSESALQAWFETNARRYEIPARVSVFALEVPSAPFIPSVTLSEARIRAAYDANPARYPAPDAPTPPAAPANTAEPGTNQDAAFLAVRGLVEADLRSQRAGQAALDAASDLAVELLEKNVKPSAVADILKGREGVNVIELGVIGAGAIPPELGGESAAAKILPEVARLASDRPFSNPVATPTGAALLVWREAVAARTPELAEVKAQALADYEAAEKRRLFSEAGRALQATVSAAVANGEEFAKVARSAAESAGLSAEIKTPTPFTLSSQFPPDMDYTALQALQTLTKGKVSDFLPSGEAAGVLVFAIDQQAPVSDPSTDSYADLKTRLAENLAQANAQALLTSRIAAESAKVEPVLE